MKKINSVPAKIQCVHLVCVFATITEISKVECLHPKITNSETLVVNILVVSL